MATAIEDAQRQVAGLEEQLCGAAASALLAAQTKVIEAENRAAWIVRIKKLDPSNVQRRTTQIQK